MTQIFADNLLEIDSLHKNITPSQSDRLLREWGFDLVREYFLIAQHLPSSNAPVIELATGTGRMSAVLSCLFPNVITGDISLQDLPRTRERIPRQYLDRVQFLQLDMEHLPFKNHSVRSVVCINTFHEIKQPHGCLQELLRIVHPNGTLIAGDFNSTGFEMMQKIHETVYHNNHDEGSFSLQEIELHLSEAFNTIQTVMTPLNTSFVATNKR